MKPNKIIAIIFLDEIHHVYHFISVAVELSKKNQVHILTNPGKHTFLHNTLQQLDGKNVIIEKLPTSAIRAFTDKLKGRKLPRKGFWIKKNQNYLLNNFDALIFTDYFHQILLKSRKNKEKPKFIKFPHGVAGRAYAYRNDLLDFDMHLIFGNYYYEQLKKKNLLSKHTAVVGYPKLDVLKNVETERIFHNDKPVVLYTPHFSPPFSSWHFMGLEVLEFFYNSKDHNLIFAPHINLFNKIGGDNASVIPEKYLKAKNIHIDLGSNKSVDMTYLRNADIYLGDVSSQIFEFIINARPCIFINAEEIDCWNDDNYRFWKCGEVIETVDELPNALATAKIKFEIYKPIQEKITTENFYMEEGSTASERAAKAINLFLDQSEKD